MARILLVDDDEDILFLLEFQLEQAGHTVASTSAPSKVVWMAKGGHFDAVVLDIMMPKISGWQVLAGLRAQPETRTTPVVLLTALSSVSDRVRGLRGGADDYLTKPFEPEELIARVEGLIARQSVGTAALQGQLEMHSVQELLQHLDQSHKSGVLEIFENARSGTIVLHQGQISTASFSGRQAEEAVLALLELRQGSFRFQPNEAATQGHVTQAVAPLLIQAAWIEDELALRRHLLPNPLRLWKLLSDLPEVPESMPELPLEVLAEEFSRPGGASLSGLLQQGFAAPNRIRLAVAWLLEQGALAPHAGNFESTLPKVSSPPSRVEGPLLIPEDLDMAIREFLQEAVFRGFPLDPVDIAFSLHPSCWSDLHALLLTLPGNLLGDLDRECLLLNHCGQLKFSHPAGTLRFSFCDYENTCSVPESKHCASLVFWFDETKTETHFRTLATFIAQQSPQIGCLVLSTQAKVRAQAATWLADHPRWHVPQQLPESFDQLLMELAHANPGCEA